MKTYISLLRGINVSGKNKISKTELSALYEACGFSDVSVYIQSGNIVFRSATLPLAKLKDSIQTQLENHFDCEIPVLVWPAKDFHRIAERNPFINIKGIEQDKLHITFLSDLPVEFPLVELEKAKKGNEDYRIIEKAVYVYCPHGYGTTRLSNTFFETKLKVRATTRNLKTVYALCEIADRLQK